ncbi:hypothetical protein [Pedosphaera parvula]|uniref:Uncharacterized protein n=1 Tax=Pedosphaera parvula (strain Ellin514) TaxID=320771 RepID=B9XSR0_PEDPL|nr:hypothetical protein [Pedosphaera parvula]EEF57112.1 hypothetical protein Cflav_PD0152 [Pedosphaera parvula Ellin514]
MNLSTIFVAVFSVIMIWNIMDWKPGSDEKLLYLPKSKALKILLLIWAITAALSALALLLDFIPSWLFLLITIGFASALQVISVVIREKLRKQNT